MKRILCATFILAPLILISVAQASSITDSTTIILVRHAEKLDDGSSDPQLSEDGLRRAQNLKTVLKDFDISVIYSTGYNRTQQTATPIAQSLNLEIITYQLDAPDSLLQEIIDKNISKTVLIVGHSNTTPLFVNTLLGYKKYEWLDENDFEKIFVIKASEVGKATDELFTY